jgi:hypothetical protein
LGQAISSGWLNIFSQNSNRFPHAQRSGPEFCNFSWFRPGTRVDC